MTFSGKTWAAGEALGAEHRTDHNALADAVKNVRGFDVSTYGADPSNTAAANSTAFEAALAAIEALDDDGSEGSTLFVPFGTYRLARSLELKRNMIIQGVAGRGTASGSRLLFDAGVTGIVIHHASTSGDGSQGANSLIRDIALIGGGQGDEDAPDGVEMHARATLSHAFVEKFGGNGINITADVSGGTGNANNWSLSHVRVQNCGGHGLFVDGGDSNAGSAYQLDCTSNGGWGILDSSFLGNTYVACHVANNGMGAYKVEGANNDTELVACYSESGQPASEVSARCLIVGGNHGAGFSSTDIARLAAEGSEVTAQGDGFTVQGSSSRSKVTLVSGASHGEVNIHGVDPNGLAKINFYPEASLHSRFEADSANGYLRLVGQASQFLLYDNGLARVTAGFRVSGDFDHDGTGVGFYGTAPAAKPTVTGSTDTEKIDSLITALASLGLITDSTT